MPPFDRIAIVGVGLIGGSLGMAIRGRRLAREVIGCSRKPATLRRAKARGAIDVGTTNPRDAVRQADLVVLATPVDRVAPLGRRLARWMTPGSVLTDVGSTKGEIVSALRRLPRGVAFVGGHPLAGSEQRGVGAAQATLFRGATVILTPTARTPRRALSRVGALWRSLGARVTRMSPTQHDRLLADISHLPHALACALVRSAGGARRIAPLRSFLEMTRIAKSDPGLWDAIFLSNRAPLLRAMDRFDGDWRALRRDVRRRRAAALRRRLAAAQRKRTALDEPSAHSTKH